MGIIIDIFILAVLTICTLLGFKRGLSKSIFKIISFVLAIILTFILYKPVSNIVIEKTQINERMKNSIIKQFNKDEKDETKDTNNGMLGNISESIKNTTEETKDMIVEQTATEISNKIIDVGIAILLFLLIRIILLIVMAALSIIINLPLIKQVDKAGGIIYGILEGLLIVYVILTLISFMSVIDALIPVKNAIENSLLGNWLYNNNIIVKLFF